eukprot:3770215-Rhodomonas_salina.1
MQARPGTPVSTTPHATARHAWRCNCKSRSDLPTRAPAPVLFARGVQALGFLIMIKVTLPT